MCPCWRWKAHPGRQMWFGQPRQLQQMATLTRAFDLENQVYSPPLPALLFLPPDRKRLRLRLCGSVSADGGQTWQGLEATHMQKEERPGMTPAKVLFLPRFKGGDSGGWVEGQIDLTPFVRITLFCSALSASLSPVLTFSGFFALDNVAIPEIGFVDDVEQEQGLGNQWLCPRYQPCAPNVAECGWLLLWMASHRWNSFRFPANHTASIAVPLTDDRRPSPSSSSPPPPPTPSSHAATN